MDHCTTIVIVLVILTQCLPNMVYGTMPRKGGCDAQNQCKRDECCVSNHHWNGRRAVKDYEGMCQKYGSLESECYISPDDTDPNGNLMQMCPCGQFLECQGTGEIEYPYGEKGICKPKRCNSATDCPKEYCCVSNVRPIGKRSVESSYIGTCQPMGSDGSSCLVSNERDPAFETCPCGKGLKCVGSGIFDIPLGELGECS